MSTTCTANCTNIAKAKATLSEGSVPQYYDGGPTSDLQTVRGAKDGRTYRAKPIGRPASGLLSPGPKLILANERGPEYFVNHLDVKDPAIFDHVLAIEALKGGRRIRQFAEGGATEVLAKAATSTAATAGGSTMSPEAIDALNRNTAAIERFNAQLDAGIYALVDDGTAIALRNRVDKLDRVAGGRVR